MSIGHPFALGPGGARTIVNSNAISSGSLTINYSGKTSTITAASWNGGIATITAANTFAVGQTVTIAGMTPNGYNGVFTILTATASSFTYALASSPGIATGFGTATSGAIPTQYLNYAQVQTLSFTGATAGTTRFTLSYNGETTAPITFNLTPAGVTAIENALNNLPTILNIQANVTVALVAGQFQITFGGSLGGMEIPTINSAITVGPGSLSVGVIPGTTPIGFQVPNQFLTLNGPGKAGIFVTPRAGSQTQPLPVGAPEVTGALNNQAGHNSWEQTITFWSTPTSPLQTLKSW